MRAILEWVYFLSIHGAPVASPIPSRDHQLIETIEQDGQTYLAVLFEKAKGILAEALPVEQWDETLVQNLGGAAGKMHAVAKLYIPTEGALRRPDWDQAGNCYHPTEALDSSQAGVQEKRAKILEIVRGLPKDRDNYGMIHADFHGGNFFVDVESKTITVFDFDDCCCGWYAMDIAMSLFDILVLYSGQEPQRFAAWFLENYLLGYSGKNGLSPFWIDRLPLFLKLLETGVYTQVYRFIDIDFTGIYKRALAMRNPQA